jgi:hypothetical protein
LQGCRVPNNDSVMANTNYRDIGAFQKKSDNAGSFYKGFNFRATSGYVTDDSGDTYVLDTDTYPVSRNGITFGWTVAPTSSRDRSTTQGVKLAGINYGNNNGTFQVDLPTSGSYVIRLALGDAGSNQVSMALTLKDNSTTILSLSGITTDFAQYADTCGRLYYYTTWPSANYPLRCSFASSTFIAQLGAASSNTTIAHIAIYRALNYADIGALRPQTSSTSTTTTITGHINNPVSFGGF